MTAEIKLTSKQQAALDHVMSDPQSMLVLTGEAGGGKTFTSAVIASRVYEGALFASPTHQAAGVLRTELAEKGCNATVATVASLLGTRPNLEEQPDSVLDSTFVRLGDGKFSKLAPRGGLLVIDEVSMVSEPDVAQLVELAIARGMRIIFAGDPEQLTPVNAKEPWDLIDQYVLDNAAVHVHLDQNMRAKGQELNSIINYVRANKALPSEVSGPVKFYTDPDQWIAELARVAGAAGTDIDQLPVGLAYRNATVGEIDSAVRGTLGYDADWYGIGELLRVAQPHETKSWHEAFKELKRTMGHDEAFKQAGEAVKESSLQTGDIVEVLAIGEPFEWKLPYLQTSAMLRKCKIRVRVGATEGHEFETMLPAVGSMSNKRSSIARMLGEFYNLARELSDAIKAGGAIPDELREFMNAVCTNARLKWGETPTSGQVWQLFYKTRGTVLNAGSATAMTVHKAQGSGRRVVFVDATDLDGGPASLLYVGVSRAREQLHVLVN